MANRKGSPSWAAKSVSASARFCPLRGVLPALAIALVASGCSSRLGQFTGSLRDVPNNSAPAAIASGDLNALAQRYDARPGEKAASLAYGSALRARGQFQQAVAVLQRASIVNVGDKEIARPMAVHSAILVVSMRRCACWRRPIPLTGPIGACFQARA